jgi:hypothetical protein
LLRLLEGRTRWKCSRRKRTWKPRRPKLMTCMMTGGGGEGCCGRVVRSVVDHRW